MDHLPTELLLQIARHVVEQDSEAVQVLRRISRRWNEVVSDAADLWRGVVVDCTHEDKLPSAAAKIRQFNERSRQQVRSLTIHLSSLRWVQLYSLLDTPLMLDYLHVHYHINPITTALSIPLRLFPPRVHSIKNLSITCHSKDNYADGNHVLAAFSDIVHGSVIVHNMSLGSPHCASPPKAKSAVFTHVKTFKPTQCKIHRESEYLASAFPALGYA